MEHSRMALAPLERAGEVTTFYSYDSGATRSTALANAAALLAARDNATLPVLMIDWDTESPTLHHVFDLRDEHEGVLELFEACRDYLQVVQDGTPATPPDPLDTTLAMQVLEAVDWQRFVQRVDQSRSLYLIRAGCFDADYGRRASQMDWEALFCACPALFRSFAQLAARYFRHVMVDARGGRSATVSICTSLLPDKLVTLFTPNQRSLDGMEGVVMRAIHYRRSHEEEQRPLVAYPVACAVDSTDGEHRHAWRYGDASKGLPGYQGVLERMLRQCYGLSQLSIDSYLDEVQLQQARSLAGGVPLLARDEPGGDRFSLTRSLEALLAWLADGYFPWQSREEVALLDKLASLQQGACLQAGARDGAATPIALQFEALGQLYAGQGRYRQALDCFQQCASLREGGLGMDHPATVAAHTSMADMLRHMGKLNEARTHYEVLDSAQRPPNLAARSGLACTLAQQNHFAQALDLEASVGAALEQQFGASHPLTLDSFARQADILSRQGRLSRAWQADEQVLEGRRQRFGAQHASTLAVTQHMAMVLCRMGDVAQARQLQEQVLAAHLRHRGPDHPDTLAARAALAAILQEQGELDSAGQRSAEPLRHPLPAPHKQDEHPLIERGTLT